MQAKQVLHNLLQKIGSQMHKMRRTALAVNVMGALHGEVLTVKGGHHELRKRETLYQASRSVTV
jgi:hypothetical protein